MTRRVALMDAFLAQEEPLSDLRALLSALDLIASASQGIEKADMIGLRIVTRYAKDIAHALHQSWKVTLDCAEADPRLDEDPAKPDR